MLFLGCSVGEEGEPGEVCGLVFLGQQALCSIRGELGAVQEAEEAVQHAEVIVVEEL